MLFPCYVVYFVVKSNGKKKDQNNKCIRHCTLINRIKSVLSVLADLFIASCNEILEIYEY